MRDEITYVFDAPSVERVGFLTWKGWQGYTEVHSVPNDRGNSERYGSYSVVTYTKGGAYRKLAKRQLERQDPKPGRPRRQVQVGKDGAVQYQAGGDLYVDERLPMGKRHDQGKVPYDPSLDWPDRYPDGGR